MITLNNRNGIKRERVTVHSPYKLVITVCHVVFAVAFPRFCRVMLCTQTPVQLVVTRQILSYMVEYFDTPIDTVIFVPERFAVELYSMEGDGSRRDKACARCYTQKLKCSRPANQGVCERCARLRVQCRPRQSRDRGLANTDGYAQSTTAPNPTLDSAIPMDSTASRTEQTDGLQQPAPLTPNILNTPSTYVSNDIQFLDVNDGSDWREHDFMPNNFDGDVFNTSMLADIDPSLVFEPRSTSEPIVKPIVTCTTSGPSSLNSWVNDLARLNTSICAFSSEIETDTIRSGTRVRRQLSEHEPEAKSSIAMSSFEPAYRMATELSALINRLYTGRQTEDRTQSEVQIEQGSRGSPSKLIEQLPQHQHVSDILNDPSNILLLTSTYSRLLELINSTIMTLQSKSPPCDVNISLGAFDLANKPSMKTFVIVNMVEMLIRHTDHILKLVDNEVNLCSNTNSKARSLDDNEFDRRSRHRRLEYDLRPRQPIGLGFVLEMVGEQQETLLNTARESRRQLLAAADV